MADYKIVDAAKLDSDLTSVANAIRARAGTSVKISFPEGFASAIRKIPGDVGVGGEIEVESLSKVHYWTKTGLAGSTIEETYQSNGTTIGFMNETVQYADKVALNGDTLVLVNPVEYTVTSDDDAAEEVLLGKYVYCLNNFYRIPLDAVIIYYAASQYVEAHLNVNKAYKLSVTTGNEERVTVVVSDDINAYPKNGEQDGFTYVYQGVVSSTLPELTNPAFASDMVEGVEAYVNGEKVTGEMAQWKNGAGYAGTVSFQDDSLYIDSPDMTSRRWIENGEHVYLRTDAANLGDATAADVAKGKTFTSADGLRVEGELEVPSFTITDDGAGNVTITSESITDNSGDVTIA